MGSPIRIGNLRNPNETMRLVVTIFVGAVAGFFVGVSFSTISVTKVHKLLFYLFLYGCVSDEFGSKSYDCMKSNLDFLIVFEYSFNPVQHQKTKHIEIDVRFVRERVAKKQLFVQFVSSKEQFADILTKGLSAPLFHTHCNNLMLGLSRDEFEGG